MATLDVFLSRGKKKNQSLTLQDTKAKHAFVNPFTTVVKKPLPLLKASPKLVKNQPKTITQYFTPMDVDIKMEEKPAEVCIIRHKMSVIGLWNSIQDEFDQDPFYNDDFEQNVQSMKIQVPIISSHCSNRRRRSQSDVDQNTNSKRQKKTDYELSSIMTRFLTMGTAVKHQPTSLEFLNEFSEETEDLSRPIRHKQTLQESYLLVCKLTQEFLY
ncbi:hypothetical protein [Parasitella parasitica]|uniref:Uncharacterized protein n=1 Tax=Parasitella parasitica TaxID=35722 RepID=A0A0B7N4N2_9FUNG|nr:hypothetical protein [Parasitella parasitica]